MMQHGYVRGVTPPAESLARLCGNIDIVCQLAGNVNHVGIGSDLDGGYGNEQTPVDLQRISDLQVLPDLLSITRLQPARYRSHPAWQLACASLEKCWGKAGTCLPVQLSNRLR